MLLMHHAHDALIPTLPRYKAIGLPEYLPLEIAKRRHIAYMQRKMDYANVIYI